MKKIDCIIMFCLMVVVSSTIYAQKTDNEPKVGISALVSSIIEGSQLDIVVPIWAGSKFVVAPSIYVLSIQDAGSDIGVGILLRNYFRKSKVAPFICGRVGLYINAPKDDDSATDFLYGIGIGSEYFIDKNLSLGFEAQVNATTSDENSSRFGNPGKTNINTATAGFVTIYF
jgi:hypothetical protein